eukprot:CAMPEP_0170062350 /NCGR_PEP_ID=MMETSP0019_2-20121128/3606_1 /TAXON_ID=98059 /ORGANISM="Dinobryon sp., Strain UTEXLB2267" /LENGTH=1130 /DNA_ID=CAMNT_0010268469 /DNA_START=454 /DNA_END=3846 /DNA_ORIENTATION=+
MTALSLQFLAFSQPNADVVIVDDHSIDGTAEYLVKKGYFVIVKDIAKGLTDSWNVAFQFAVSMDYKYVIFTNNDVLVTEDGLRILQSELRKESLVVPLTSHKGAGHNVLQSITKAYHLPAALTDFTYSHRTLLGIQATLTRFATNKSDLLVSRKFPRVVKSMRGKQPVFNGFLFAINVSGIAKAAHAYPHELFDSSNLVFGQEDDLMARMMEHGMIPKIAMCVYMFHFKSVTVGTANTKAFYQFQQALSRTKINATQVGSRRSWKVRLNFDSNSSNVANPFDGTDSLESSSDQQNNSMVVSFRGSKVVDIRDSLHYFHPEVDPQKSLKRTLSKRRVLLESSDLTQNTTPKQEDVSAMYLSYGELQQSVTRGFAEYPQPADLLRDLPESLDEAANSLRQLLTLNVATQTRKVVAIAMSDPAKNPSAGDIFTAKELGSALQAEFNVEVVYLRKGQMWYSAQYLSQVDVLVTLLDDYDLSKLFSGSIRHTRDLTYAASNGMSGAFHSGIKASLITVAWMRNWFHRWLTRPWIGNYDLLLTSSQTAADFFRTIASSVGLNVACSFHCPKLPKHAHAFPAGTDSTPVSLANRPLISRRLNVPVKVLRLATNHLVFSSKVPHTATKTEHDPLEHAIIRELRAAPKALRVLDYVFTGSYFNQPRQIMDFDPAHPLLSRMGRRGAVFGKDWQRANVTNGWKQIAVGPISYDLMPLIYSKTKIVIDDANHVTRPWGSVNSRVFDGLASGALVLSNGWLGLQELFQQTPSNLLTSSLGELVANISYSSGENLAFLLDFFLSHEQQRLQVVAQLQAIVLSLHTYRTRAFELAGLLIPFNVELGPRLNFSNHSLHAASNAKDSTNKANTNSKPKRRHNTSSLCIGVRTMESQWMWLEILVQSLAAQYRLSNLRNRVLLQLYITCTETVTTTFEWKLRDLADRINALVGGLFLIVFSDPEQPQRHFSNPFYGYDSTDTLLSHLLSKRKLFDLNEPWRVDTINRMAVNDSSLLLQNPCEWIMFTNGDNLYNSAWFQSVAEVMLHDRYEFVAWDFVTHHTRQQGAHADTMEHQQSVRVELKRRFIDLGSAMVKADLYIKSNVLFLPDSLFSKDLFARDYFSLEKLAAHAKRGAVHMIHRILMFHQ